MCMWFIHSIRAIQAYRLLLTFLPFYLAAKSNTLCFAVVRELDRWTRLTNHEHSDRLDKQLRIRAFQTSIRFHTTCLDLIAKAYQLSHPGNQYLLQYVHPILARKKYKDVSAHIVSKRAPVAVGYL